MKAVPKSQTVPPNCTLRADGSLYARVKVGANNSPTKLTDDCVFAPGWTTARVVAWQTDRRRELADERGPKAVTGTLLADVTHEYPRLAKLRVQRFTDANAERRLQQQLFWCAQSVTLGTPVLSPQAVRGGARGTGKTLGELPRHKLIDHVDRLSEILLLAFPPSQRDEYAHAGSSNHYRLALSHLFTVLDRRNPSTPNPLTMIDQRVTRGPQPKAIDMRLVAAILRHFPSLFGKDSLISQLRLAVLAWVHITPIQLQRLGTTLPKAFHDKPTATREEMIGGAITLTVPPRFKGRRKRAAEPYTIPLTPYGVEALRAYVAEPKAWGAFSLPSLNKGVKRAAGRAQVAFAKQGLDLDLSGFSLYHLKHSLATVATVASGGMVDLNGQVRQHPGVQKALAHANPATTAIYTAAAADPLLRHVNAATALFLDTLFAQPLVAPAIKIARRARA